MNTRTVLIVDEEKINRNVLANILQSDYSIILASNGKEALRILKTNFKRISVIILDLEMFAMDGYELLKNIHSNPDYMNIPIIAAAQNYSELADDDLYKKLEAFLNIKAYKDYKIFRIEIQEDEEKGRGTCAGSTYYQEMSVLQKQY